MAGLFLAVDITTAANDRILMPPEQTQDSQNSAHTGPRALDSLTFLGKALQLFLHSVFTQEAMGSAQQSIS